MFNKVRLENREITKAEAMNLLEQNDYGVLSTVGENGYPYGVPMSYVVLDNAVYFHCGKEGHKIDNIKYNDKVSFAVVGKSQTLAKEFTVDYSSVIVFGTTSEVSGDEKYNALLELIKKYSSEFLEEGKAYIAKGQHKTKVIKIQIDHITGKGR